MSDLIEEVSLHYQQQLKQSPAAISFLKGRGLNGQIAKKFEIGFAPAGWDNLLKKFRNQSDELFELGLLVKKDNGQYYDRFRERVIFPIKDKQGRAIAFSGRVLDDSKPKYINSPESILFSKRNELYAQQFLNGGRVVVVEGQMDVVALTQFGINNVVAGLGTAITESQIEYLYKNTEVIVFCFDGDAAGLNAAWKTLGKILPFLNDNKQARFVFLPKDNDPDSFIRSEGLDKLEDLIEHSCTAIDYLLENTIKQMKSDYPHHPSGINSIEDKVVLLHQVKPFYNILADGFSKELLEVQVSRITGLEEVSKYF